MGGITQPQTNYNRLLDDGDTSNEPTEYGLTPRIAESSAKWQQQITKNEDRKRAEEAELNQLNQQIAEVRQQREDTQAQAEQSRIEIEAKKNALANQQRALEQTGAVDEVGGGSVKPHNPTSSSSTTVEGGGRDARRKRSQLTAYLNI